MIIFLEGPRASGKSTLLKSLSSEIEKFQFEFVNYVDYFQLERNSRNLHDFSLGKDLMLMQLNRDGIIPFTVVDRGPLTVIVYSLMDNRISEKEIGDFKKLLIENNLWKDCYVILLKTNKPQGGKRIKNEWNGKDVWSNLEGLDWEYYEKLQDFVPKENLIPFENHYNEESIERFKELIKNLKNGKKTD